MILPMKVQVRTLVNLLEAVPINGLSEDFVVEGVSAASAACRPGYVFAAARGVKADGHDFIEDAFSHGAALAVVSDASKIGNRPGLLVTDSRRALSRLADYFAGSPSRDLICVGVSGTNGKTTINWIIHNLFVALGKKSIRIGTLGTFSEGVIDRREGLTTPDAVRLHEDLALARSKGVQAAVMETSSHSLDQERVADIAFDAGVFTNLTRDHLDYHGDMENYFKAKNKLFALLAEGKKSTKIGVVNVDCPYGRRLLQFRGMDLISYGTSSHAMMRVQKIEGTSSSGSFVLSFQGASAAVQSRFIGRHNALNIAAAMGVCTGLGYSFNECLTALESVPQVPGRLEHLQGRGLDVFVDYAHTPDALENALGSLREVSTGKLWVVFGCGGDRDRGKRPQMAEIAARIADEVVVTSDNPRTEDPLQIINDIMSSGVKARIVDPDRRTAIREALLNAAPGDVVLIAGKGHEDYQILGTTKHHFSDSEEVRAVLG